MLFVAGWPLAPGTLVMLFVAVVQRLLHKDDRVVEVVQQICSSEMEVATAPAELSVVLTSETSAYWYLTDETSGRDEMY